MNGNFKWPIILVCFRVLCHDTCLIWLKNVIISQQSIEVVWHWHEKISWKAYWGREAFCNKIGMLLKFFNWNLWMLAVICCVFLKLGHLGIKFWFLGRKNVCKYLQWPHFSHFTEKNHFGYYKYWGINQCEF